MKPTENIEEFVRLEKPHVTTGGAMDKRTLNDSFAAMDENIRANKLGAAGIILRSRAARFAAAAVIILAVGLLMVYRNPAVPPPNTVSAAESPAEILTVASLNIAYRRGGMRAVEKQYEEAAEMRGPRPAEISLQELLAEFDSI